MTPLRFHTRFLCSVNGFVGSSLGRVIPPKSPPPPLPPPGNGLVPTSRKTDLRVVIPQSKGVMQTLVSVFIVILPSTFQILENFRNVALPRFCKNIQILNILQAFSASVRYLLGA